MGDICYNMLSRTDYKIGDIVRCDYPDGSIYCEGKNLGLVIDSDSDGYQIIFLSGQIKDSSSLIVLSNNDIVEGQLSHDYTIIHNKQFFVNLNKINEKIAQVNSSILDQVIRKMIEHQVQKHYQIMHNKAEFIPGESYIRYAGRVYDHNEIPTLVNSSLDFWLTSGKYARQFETEFASFLGTKYCLLTNSGSSANLLAMSALTSYQLGEKRLNPGDEVITTACAFPTTVNPIIQNNLIPVFVDVDLKTSNIQADYIESALSEKTKAIFIAHSLGNPFDLEKIMHICEKNDLWLIEDNCDSLGSTFNEKLTGTFGDLGTHSFYPAHHMTMGEGGAVVTDNPLLKRIVQSYRDWGRDCWCNPGEDNTCGSRFTQQFGTLPIGYDHKYVYSHIGYNLKLTDMQAAVGVEQLKKLPQFISSRKRNFNLLDNGLKKHEKYLILPTKLASSDPSWFGFLITVRKNAPFTRDKIVQYLEENQIATRMLFAGNITRHKKKKKVSYRIHGELLFSDQIMNNSFWIGVYPGLNREQIDYIIEVFDDFINL